MSVLSIRRHKNSRFFYFARHALSALVPDRVYRNRLPLLLASVEESDRDHVRDRVDYYNRITKPFALDERARPLRLNLFGKRHNYYFDLHEYTRYFPREFRLGFKFGDWSGTPTDPTIVKARRLEPRDANSILFNLNKVRHFNFVDDDVPFEAKLGKAVWRGKATREHRRKFLEALFDDDLCDVGQTDLVAGRERWHKPYMSIGEQLKYKFVISVEGMDVATNLKWILSSNSLCLMTKPRFETWFMEGRLIPDHHYVLLKDDYSDFDEKMRHYLDHPRDARRMLENAKSYVAQFRHKAREDAVALLVLYRYFEMSGQIPALAPPF